MLTAGARRLPDPESKTSRLALAEEFFLGDDVAGFATYFPPLGATSHVSDETDLGELTGNRVPATASLPEVPPASNPASMIRPWEPPITTLRASWRRRQQFITLCRRRQPLNCGGAGVPAIGTGRGFRGRSYGHAQLDPTPSLSLAHRRDGAQPANSAAAACFRHSDRWSTLS